ncbi:hypothetical protein [Actinoallomurus soli]|uniref:hypothetical protein n=1 Tax=Actinoallomurus soli TaxID=2952535 RepID=UPI002093EF86|nr:hypothetical protein [Actinoallomurus soli]MCO5974410.1 hypothetical protein [Actinoallomurus soli]
MPMLMVRYEVAEENAAEVAAAIDEVFAAVRERQPEGVRYAYLRAVHGTEFVALLELPEGVENPLPGIEAARRLQEVVARCAVGPAPVPRPLDVLGDHRLFG